MRNTPFVWFSCTLKQLDHIVTILWSETKSFYLLAEQRVQLFWDVVLFVFDLWLSQSDCDVWIGLPINVSWMQISCLPKKLDKLRAKWILSSSERSMTVFSLNCKEDQNMYPDNIDADKDIDGVVVRNVLKHSHVGVEAHVSGHVIWHFVHAQRALKGNN